MRRIPLFAVLAAFTLLAAATPLTAHATAIPYWGPIVPTLNATCAGSWGGVVQLANNIIAFLVTLAIAIIAPLTVAYAGFLYTVNPAAPNERTKANTILQNTALGILVSLTGWLMVNALLVGLTGKGINNWSAQMFNNGTQVCLNIQTDTFNQAAQTPSATGSGNANAAALDASGSGPCNPTLVANAAQAAGYHISVGQSKQLACIAKYESSCGQKNAPANKNYSWNKNSGNGKASTAAGAFQVLLSSNSQCYDNSVCESAAGSPGTALNCKSAFDSNGFEKTDAASQAVLAKCLAAASSYSCSAAAASCQLQRQSFTSMYAADSNVGTCANQYSS